MHILKQKSLGHIFYFATLLFALSACGKYGVPLPPESVSPTKVVDLQVVADLQGVRFQWKAPEKNQRSRELKSIDGYRIYRKPIIRNADVMSDEVEYELIATVEDTHLQLLEDKRKEAKEAGKPMRRVSVDDKLKKFEYSDITVEAGKTYVYQVIPFNQGDVEGEIGQLVRVLFRGESSEITLIPFSQLKDSSFETF